MKKYIVFYLLVATLTSCVKDIDLTDLKPHPSLVLNSFINPDSTFRVSVSRTQFMYEKPQDLTLSNADVSLFINNELKEKLRWEKPSGKKGYYVSTYQVQADDHIRIEAHAPGYTPVRGETSMPVPVKIKSIQIEKTRTDLYAATNLNILITFQDLPGKDNYYGINILTQIRNRIEGEDAPWVDQEPSYRVSFSFKENIVFNNRYNVLDDVLGNTTEYNNTTGLIFSNELIKGKEYTLKASTTIYQKYVIVDENGVKTEENHDYRFIINLSSVSESYHLHFKSIENKMFGGIIGDLSDSGGLAEPFSVYSNIEGGAGIVGTYQIDTRSAVVPYEE